MTEENEDYRVSDKRKFDSEGNLRRDAPDDNDREAPREPPQEAQAIGEEKAEGAGQIPPEAEAPGAPPQEITFTAFILSLGTQAMVGLGLMPDPMTNETTENLEFARQMIEILALLRDKTKGNLEADEITLMDNLLHDLQMQYVDKTK